ncbi:hypothetical protein H0E87_017038 [Populus deltoides]|uniref:Peptidase S8/S53 domain-containing protein n=1 Tax=Populus deltoides TaxID=3696 RepID=A0A8T2XYN9_POPDE|nr:hypothetical protein H0E87_017038 [Populus deltoides]
MLAYSKVIGARSYDLENRRPDENTPVDDEGHGTHTSSTVAGISVEGASLYGLGQGTARGGVPSSRLAIYKVCYEDGCSDMDIMAAFDDAIQDGADMISLSVGGPVSDYFNDAIAIGSFHAMKKGILTSCAAGNEGPALASVGNVTPWILTDGASGMDRQFRTPLTIGNSIKTSGSLSGSSHHDFYFNFALINIYYKMINKRNFCQHLHTKSKNVPSSSAAQAWNDSVQMPDAAGYCFVETLDKNKVKGKIVLCKGGSDSDVKEMGGVKMIVASDDSLDTGFTLCNYFLDLVRLQCSNPYAVISKSKTVNVSAPFVASFSSRGPKLVSPTILKPDIVAPGIDILAAYSKLVTVTGEPIDNRVEV